MKNYSKLFELPLSGIRPRGWLKDYLMRQRDGLTGHIEETGYPFDTDCWKVKTGWKSRFGLNWWPYEQTGYWIDGMMRCGHLLRDRKLIKRAQKFTDTVIKQADPDGYLGPDFTKPHKRWNRWPHSIFFRAMMADYSATGSRKVLPALAKHYLSDKSATSVCASDRSVCCIESILWTYGQTGDRRLLDYAVKTYRDFHRVNRKHECTVSAMLSGRRATTHGVTYNETAKLGAIMYMYTGRKKYLEATINAYRKIDKFQMLVSGVCSSSEHLEGKDPLDSHETCDIADYTWSAGYLLLATGRVEYADKIERACFNAAPGAVLSDFRALQYLSCPNQVIADSQSNHNLYLRGGKLMQYDPAPFTACCPGEVNRIMPNFASRMWFRDRDGALVAAMYSPCSITAETGRNRQKVTITEDTKYPFSDRINFRVKTSKPVNFTLKLRIPGWCRGARISVNGKTVKCRAKAGSYAVLKRRFLNNDCVTLLLPMETKVTDWPRGGISVERGPLVYSLPVREKRSKGGKDISRRFHRWNLRPAGRWNYALNGRDILASAKAVFPKAGQNPWNADSPPVKLLVPAVNIPGWQIDKRKVFKQKKHSLKKGFTTVTLKCKKNFTFTPQLPGREYSAKPGSMEVVELVPYGCTNLRVTVFPRYRHAKN